MPNKSRRVAVKQAQLSHKKKRVTRDSSLVGDGYSGLQGAGSQDDSRLSDVAHAAPISRQLPDPTLMQRRPEMFGLQINIYGLR